VLVALNAKHKLRTKVSCSLSSKVPTARRIVKSMSMKFITNNICNAFTVRVGLDIEVHCLVKCPIKL